MKFDFSFFDPVRASFELIVLLSRDGGKIDPKSTVASKSKELSPPKKKEPLSSNKKVTSAVGKKVD